MGGHRCSYRNCSARSDGKLHMFHYPVFDKVRCHQWLTNAQKVEFLNLKVSQLKNRVVCQHHFKNECFMNFKKDKLTFDAVPTEDGPYCETKQSNEIKPPKILNTISLDDIENEYLTFNDKKANYSMKYGDFLTNGDLMDLEPTILNSQNTKLVPKEKGFEEIPIQSPITNNTAKQSIVHKIPFPVTRHTAGKKVLLLNKNHDTVNTPTISHDTSLNNMTVNTPPYLENNDTNKNVYQVPIENVNIDNINVYVPQATPLDNDRNTNVTVASAMDNNTLLTERPNRTPYRTSEISDVQNDENSLKVTLVSVEFDDIQNQQQRVDQKYNVTNNLSDNKEDLNSKNSSILKPMKKIQILSEKKISDPAIMEKLEPLGKLQPVSPSGVLPLPKKFRSNIPLRGKLMKKKIISPERVAAIQEKRKFNMKLRDIIESCLDKLDGEDEKNYMKNTSNSDTEKVSSFLSKDPGLSNVHDYTVAYLESRIQRMENNLLNKIDANSQRIIELKQTISTPTTVKKTVHTQTIVKEEAHKKQLYQEISKYLSPEANSLVYEDLFINKYMQKAPRCSPTSKRRKIR